MFESKKRWLVLLVLGATMLALMVACGGTSSPPAGDTSAGDNGSGSAATEEPAPTEEATAQGDGSLVILEWSGYEATEYPEFFGPFTEKYADNLDSMLQYSFFADDAEAYTKIQSDFQADITHPCNSWWGLYVDAGLVQPIDTSRLSNWSGVDPTFAKMGQFNGQQYFIPWDWGYESMTVRNDEVPEVPTSWADLWNPEYAGHLAIWDNAEQNFIIAALTLGIDPYNASDAEVGQIKQKLLDLKPNLLTYWVDYTETYDLGTTGGAWIISGTWQDAFATIQSDGYDVSYVQPKEGRLGWLCGYGISANSKNVDLAYEYFDAAIAPESIAALANTYWYGGSNVDALPLIDDYVKEFMQLDQMDTLPDRTFFYQPLTEEQRQTITTVWDEVKAAP
jgi:spermidine/putrescine-binding protein